MLNWWVAWEWNTGFLEIRKTWHFLKILCYDLAKCLSFWQLHTVAFRFLDVSEDKWVWHLRRNWTQKQLESLPEASLICCSFITDILKIRIPCLVYEQVLDDRNCDAANLKIIYQDSLLHTALIWTFLDALIKCCRFAVARVCLDSSCCCQVIPTQFAIWAALVCY